MNTLTIFEFDRIVELNAEAREPAVPSRVFSWLETMSRGTSNETAPWLKPSSVGGRPAIQVTSYVGVLQAPCGFQIEVLPKTGRHTSAGESRALFVEMLKCLWGFRHIKPVNADLLTGRMPLLEFFIQQFLQAVSHLVKRGMRSDYVTREGNLFSLRGKLLVARQISQNLIRRDRFYSEYDEFSPDRPENRVVRAALHRVLGICRSHENQRLARELDFAFAEVQLPADPLSDLQRVRLDRATSHYEHALDWARLILQGRSPLSSFGKHHAQSLLFPMEALFEAYVRKYLERQLQDGLALKGQASNLHLVSHQKQRWFRMKPDLLINDDAKTHLVLDTKWKLLDSAKNGSREKYQLSQADFYQLFAYGHHYLDGDGDVVLIYPKTDAFLQPLPVFDFPKAHTLRLWVLPFCLMTRSLSVSEPLKRFLRPIPNAV
ncbi:McrC family protein [Variovorax sp. PAMC26660]|uniref:McrC family protein n=1 Tax=Variovorax sp. PAMC26660 TaxID=2762322 RepID=UPI00164DF3AE|nr:McrC family protein [Variovorax sp. PAMC26660]QNK66497.1 McrC family protein [Variovorax sp. PAMC26660]